MVFVRFLGGKEQNWGQRPRYVATCHGACYQILYWLWLARSGIVTGIQHGGSATYRLISVVQKVLNRKFTEFFDIQKRTAVTTKRNNTIKTTKITKQIQQKRRNSFTLHTEKSRNRNLLAYTTAGYFIHIQIHRHTVWQGSAVPKFNTGIARTPKEKLRWLLQHVFISLQTGFLVVQPTLFHAHTHKVCVYCNC